MTPLELFASGTVIPAHPLALTVDRKLDERRQKAVGRYYAAAGAGGMAVGVHTTQFPIHDNGMLRPVLEIAMEAAREASRPLAMESITTISGSMPWTRRSKARPPGRSSCRNMPATSSSRTGSSAFTKTSEIRGACDR